MPTYLCVSKSSIKKQQACYKRVYAVSCYNFQSQMFLKMCRSRRIEAVQTTASSAQTVKISEGTLPVALYAQAYTDRRITFPVQPLSLYTASRTCAFLYISGGLLVGCVIVHIYHLQTEEILWLVPCVSDFNLLLETNCMTRISISNRSHARNFCSVFLLLLYSIPSSQSPTPRDSVRFACWPASQLAQVSSLGKYRFRRNQLDRIDNLQAIESWAETWPWVGGTKS